MNRTAAFGAVLLLFAPPARAQDGAAEPGPRGQPHSAQDGRAPQFGSGRLPPDLDSAHPAARQNSADVILDSARAQADDLARFDASAADLVAALRPAAPERYDDANYLRSVYRVTLTVHPDLAREHAFDPAAPTASRLVALNDNHTRDLPAPFLSGDAELTPAARVIIDTLAKALSAPALASSRYLIAVHTDTSGPAERNAWLAEKRAAAVIDDLVRRHGVARPRLVGAGFGEAYPLSGIAGTSPRNHRIEVTLIEADDGEEAVVAASPDSQGRRDVGPPRPGPSRAELQAERRAEAAARRRERILLARRAEIDRLAAASGEVPEAVVDRHGRIVGARIARLPSRRRFAPAWCDAPGLFLGPCGREVIVVRP